MSFHSPSRPEDVPEPSLIWALASLSCAMSSGVGDCWPEYQRMEDDGLYMDDGGGNWWRMTRVGGGRFLLVGWDRTGDTHSSCERPFDLFADAPDWLPWEWVERAEERGVIGFAYWWEGTWQRVPYPDWVEEDGLTLASYSSVDRHVFHLVDFLECVLADLSDDPDGLPGQETLDQLIRPWAEALAVGRISAEGVREMVRSLGVPLDAEAALDVLERAGLVLGEGVPPEVPAGTGRPASRRGPWAISYDEWDGLIQRAARSAVELQRPEAPESDPLRELREWLRGAAADHGGTLTYTVMCQERMSSMSMENSAGERVSVPGGPGGDVFDLRRIERHPERGSWFFLRARASPEAVTVERVYDHTPEWSGTGFGSTPSVGDLCAEMDRRSPEWRPDWVWLLDEEIPYDPPTAPILPDPV